MNLAAIDAADVKAVLFFNHICLIVEATLCSIATLFLGLLAYFILNVEIPARNQQHTFREVASPQNVLLVAVYAIIAIDFACQAWGFSSATSSSEIQAIYKVLLVGPVLLSSLLLYYSWIRSRVVVEVIVSEKTRRIYSTIIYFSPIIYALPIVIQFAVVGEWLAFAVLVSAGLAGTLSLAMDAFFTFCFIKLELNNKQNNLDVPLFYFVISRYGLAVSVLGISVLLAYIASQLALMKYSENPLLIEYWFTGCVFSVSRDVLMLAMPSVLFFMKAVLVRPAMLSGQSAGSKATEFLTAKTV
ncbi:hypothetical protein HDU98_008302 [Podochytrium sp. JEL0797]|nr:hypothetical protein HDU98_008302 [Podochytrium sp. JEL0797]